MYCSLIAYVIDVTTGGGSVYFVQVFSTACVSLLLIKEMEVKFKTTSHVTENNILWFQYCVRKSKVEKELLTENLVVSNSYSLRERVLLQK